MFDPTFHGLYGYSSRELDVRAAFLTPMSRLAFCDLPEVSQVTDTEWGRELVAWSDQRTLPLDRSSGRRGYYPTRFGMYRVVEAIVDRLDAYGVRIMVSSNISELQYGEKIEGVEIQSGDVVVRINDPEVVIWSAGPVGLARALGLPGRFPGTNKESSADRRRHLVVNLLVDRASEVMDDLHYFYCYDPDLLTFRVTNYAAYCDGAARPAGFPVSVEMFVNDEIAGDPQFMDRLHQELGLLGLFVPSNGDRLVGVERLAAGFPSPTLERVSMVRSQREAVEDLDLPNLKMIGIDAEAGLFFQPNVLAHTYRSVAQ